MKNKCFSSFLLWIVLLLSFAGEAVGQTTEIRPVNVFRRLEAGQKQTILVYGTSLTAITDWAAPLGKWLDDRYPEQVGFFNAALAGSNSDWGLANLQDRVLSHRPDLVLIEFAVNDASVKADISVEKSIANLDSMIRLMREQNPDVEIVVMTMNPAWDSPTQKDGKKYGSDRPSIENYYAAWSSYAQAHALPLIDQYPVWRKIQKEDPYRFHALVPDGIHPNKEGSLKITLPIIQTFLGEAHAAAAGDKNASALAAPVDSAPIVIRVWPEGKMPGHGAPVPEGAMISINDGKPRTINVSDPTLAVYPAKDKNAPAFIISPGGGYVWIAYNREGTEIADWLNSQGITAIILKYRIPDNKEGALQDVQRALRLAKANADAWNLDPHKLGVIGFSAGGHLSACASVDFDDPSYAPIDSIDQLSVRPDFAVLVYPAYLEIDGVLNPEFHFPADTPPILVLSNEDDTMCCLSGKVFDAALSGAGVSHEFKLYPTGGHGHGLHSTGASADWTRYMLDWLTRIGIR